MTGLTVLWLPILLSAAGVFVLSSLIHMLTPWHKGDYLAVPNEDAVMAALREHGIPPGDYMMPRPTSPAELRSEAFQEKMRRGPVVSFTVMPAGGGMGRSLTLWFVYLLVVGTFAAYIAGRALAPGAPFASVFRFVGATAFIGYALALWQMTIWYRRAWATTLRSTIDGLLYAFLTAAIFGWLWPR